MGNKEIDQLPDESKFVPESPRRVKVIVAPACGNKHHLHRILTLPTIVMIRNTVLDRLVGFDIIRHAQSSRKDGSSFRMLRSSVAQL